jgi:hypothetical protein
MKISAINIVKISVLSITLAIFANLTNAFANGEEFCLETNTDLTNNLCEQNARQLALNSNFSIMDSMFPKVERKVSNRPPIKQLFATETKEEINVPSYEDNSDSEFETPFVNWPRPKVLNRSFEFAVNSLDLNGKRDLKSCTNLQESESLASELAWDAHQLDAIIHFSNHKLSGVDLSTHRSQAKHTLQDCESLFGLILGKI